MKRPFSMRVFRISILLFICTSLSMAQRATTGSAAAIRSNNLGVAYMNQARLGEALQSFRRAETQDSSLAAARLNEGIALLNLQRLEEARDVLLDATRKQPQSARAWYNLGIAYRTLAQADAAIEAFEQVSRIDPSDPDTLYFLAQLHAQTRRYDQAIAAFEKCLALDPLHLSAEFGLARAYQLSGNDAKAAEHLARFDQLTQAKIGKQISLTYGEQGPYSTAEPVGAAEAAPADFSVRFAVSTLPVSKARSTTIGRCRYRGVLPRLRRRWKTGSARASDALSQQRRRQVFRRHGTGRTRNYGEAHGCTIGDYDNDGRDDIVIGDRNSVSIYHNEGGGRFRNATPSTGVRFSDVPLGLTLVDFDHDGDLDLYISNSTPSRPNALWRNNGNGTFTEWTVQAGLGGNRETAVAALASDLNNDRAVDLVLTGGAQPATIFSNLREGAFRASQPWASSFPSNAAGVVAFDFNKDGFMDLAFTHGVQPGLSLWRNVGGTRFERVAIPEPQWVRGWGLTAIDLDNDGWVDLVAAGERDAAGSGEVLLLRNLGDGRFADVTSAAALRAIRLDQPRALAGADVDGDGDTDLVITQNGGTPLVLKNNGGNRRSSVRLESARSRG
jgi:tetratricopeptide (TPR) repeat protein